MATILAPRRRLSTERKFFTGMAVALLAATFIGFAPTYYLRGMSGAPALGPLVHLHGIVFTSWMLLFVTQTGLISANRTDIHRMLGIAGLALAVLMIGLGLYTAVESGRLGHGPPGRDQAAFLVHPVTDMLVFGILIGFGLANRGRAAHHKRFMLLATIGVMMPALSRMNRSMQLPLLPAGPAGGLILTDVFVAALVAFDLVTKGRLHPVTLWGGGAYILSQPLRIAIGNTDTWQIFARSLIG